LRTTRAGPEPKSADDTGDRVHGLAGGQGLGLVREIKPAAVVVQGLVEGARQIIAQGLAGIATAT
jgi:hypothetical protein